MTNKSEITIMLLSIRHMCVCIITIANGQILIIIDLTCHLRCLSATNMSDDNANYILMIMIINSVAQMDTNGALTLFSTVINNVGYFCPLISITVPHLFSQLHVMCTLLYREGGGRLIASEIMIDMTMWCSALSVAALGCCAWVAFGWLFLRQHQTLNQCWFNFRPASTTLAEY